MPNHLSNQISEKQTKLSTNATIMDQDYFPLHVIQYEILWPYELKKCCKKYKKGHRCKKCPDN